MSPKALLHLLLLCFNPFAYSISFNFSSFHPNATGSRIIYQGHASNINNSIQLNRDDLEYNNGRATLVDHVLLYDSTTQSLSDFNTHFTFTIDPINSSQYSDGLTFFLAPPDFQLLINSEGGFLGLCNSTTNSIPSRNHFIAVEFDTWANEWDPVLFEHIGISINSLTSVAYVHWNSSLHRGDIANAWIRYDGSAKMLSVSLTYGDDPVFRWCYNLSYEVDLMSVLPERVMVGFTGSTGIYTESHTIHSWEFTSTLADEETDATSTKLKKAGKKIKWVVGPLILLCILVGGVSIAWVMVAKRNKNRSKQKKAVERRMNVIHMNGACEIVAGPKRFPYEALVLATNNFSDENKLGRGGFGEVYKGFLVDLDITVAVKKASRGSKQGKREYMTEVKIISQLRHRNLVQLFGWCHDHGEFLLVYEFMPNGSLDSHLFGKRHPLKWATRYKIATGLASALLYLHEEWEKCVVHRDIKSSNVMLDSGFNAKLGDFGLARLMDHELSARMTALAGTLGYMAPECLFSWRTSKESDVYSFGVVALEIACGKKPMEAIEDESLVRLVDWVWELHGNGRLLEAADKSLGSEYDVREMECLLMVGLWCAQPDPNLRPSIRQAMRFLNHEEEIPKLPNSGMTFPMAMDQVPLLAIHTYPHSMTGTCLYLGR